MAKTTQVNKLVDAERNFSYQFYVDEDSTTADLSGTVVVDVSAMDPVPTSLVVTRVMGASNDAGGRLNFDRTTDQGICALPKDSDFDIDYTVRGANGWQDNGSGSTGDVIIDTKDLNTAGSSLSFIIEGHKKY